MFVSLVSNHTCDSYAEQPPHPGANSYGSAPPLRQVIPKVRRLALRGNNCQTFIYSVTAFGALTLLSPVLFSLNEFFSFEVLCEKSLNNLIDLRFVCHLFVDNVVEKLLLYRPPPQRQD